MHPRPRRKLWTFSNLRYSNNYNLDIYHNLYCTVASFICVLYNFVGFDNGVFQGHMQDFFRQLGEEALKQVAAKITTETFKE